MHLQHASNSHLDPPSTVSASPYITKWLGVWRRPQLADDSESHPAFLRPVFCKPTATDHRRYSSIFKWCSVHSVRNCLN